MSRTLAILAFLPALLWAGVSFDTDPRPIDRTKAGASYADMLTRVMPAVVSIRTAQVVPPVFCGKNDARFGQAFSHGVRKLDHRTGTSRANPLVVLCRYQFRKLLFSAKVSCSGTF